MNPDVQSARARLERLVQDASPRLQARKEAKAADDLLRDPTLETDEVEDAVRRLEAAYDLVKLAEAEVDQELRQEEAFKRQRLTEDEALLESLETLLRLAWGVLALSFVLPLLGVWMFGPWAGAGALPAAWVLSRLVAAKGSYDGRTWLVLLDRVEATTQKVDVTLVVTYAALVVGVLVVGLGFLLRMAA